MCATSNYGQRSLIGFMVVVTFILNAVLWLWHGIWSLIGEEIERLLKRIDRALDRIAWTCFSMAAVLFYLCYVIPHTQTRTVAPVAPVTVKQAPQVASPTTGGVYYQRNPYMK